MVLEPPSAVAQKYPAPQALTRAVCEARSSIERILDGSDRRMLAIVGPCSIHDVEGALAYADELKPIAAAVCERLLVVMRLYFAKPRTVVGWKGMFYDPDLTENGGDVNKGACLVRATALEVACRGLSIATEVLDPYMIQFIDELVAWACIGARTIESPLHRELASGLSMPVGLKNAIHGGMRTVVDAVDAVGQPHRFWGMDVEGRTAFYQSTGNPYAHVVLRGTEDGPNCDPSSVLEVQTQLSDRSLRSAVVADCSHGNSGKDHTKQASVLTNVLGQRLAGNTGIVGFMLESDLVAGKQPIPRDRTTLTFGRSVTDACIGIEETRELLTNAAQRLACESS